MQPGESIECYAARMGDQTGKMDDATEHPPDKIANTGIFVKASDASLDTTFTLTPGSTKVAVTWTLTPALPAPIVFTNGHLTGKFNDADLGKPFEVLVTALDAAGTEIDSRTFRFSPVKGTATNGITMIHPLPGAIVNSKFGPRVHPITKAQKLHTGVDMKYTDRHTGDVLAAADGTVTFAGVSGTLTSGYGNCVKIQHANGSGEVMCGTTYGHMARIFVTTGQKVAAGTRIGHEGTTGSSTGNHLHFEVRLPNGTPVDPLPYIREGVTTAPETTPTGDPQGAQTQAGGGSAVSAPDSAAKGAPCPAGNVNPETGAAAPPPPPYVPPALPSGDAFEKAWFFTMQHEVGPHWMTQPQWSPGDADLDAGKIETPLNRKQCGYKPGPNFPGGETKFGVAQNPNKPNIVVTTLTYDQAKSFGKSNYWTLYHLDTEPALIAILMFDLNYLHGPNNAKKIRQGAGLTGTYNTKAEQDAACELLTKSALAFISGLNPTYQKGWIARTTDRQAYVKSLPIPLA
jgi:murein DD-endopeptidase MepM/ murein hydrolase activator NlpD